MLLIVLDVIRFFRGNMIKILILLIVLGVSALIWVFGVEPNLLEVVKYKLKVPGLEGLRVVFASDFHMAPNHEERLHKVIELINGQNPDLILLGGDFVKGHHPTSSLSPEVIAQNFGNLKAQNGVFAVLGNHDWWQDGEKITEELRKNEITVLANENQLLNCKDKRFYLAGVEDFITRKPNIAKTLNGVEGPVLLLSHSPDIFPNVPNHVDLTLAGHTHGGQVAMPFWGALLVPSEYGKRYERGLIEEDGKKILVTKGIGTSMLSVRFNCRPEIVLIEFE